MWCFCNSYACELQTHNFSCIIDLADFQYIGLELI